MKMKIQVLISYDNKYGVRLDTLTEKYMIGDTRLDKERSDMYEWFKKNLQISPRKIPKNINKSY